jgi:8-oxo-dGTP diphosphatase
MQSPGIGIGVIVLEQGKVLMGKRGEKSFFSDHWNLPGGKLELFESFEDCAKREVFEETGLRLKNLELVALHNDRMPEVNKHYLTLFFKAEVAGGELTVKEPEKMTDLAWFDLENLPSPIFPPSRNGLEKYRQGKFY